MNDVVKNFLSKERIGVISVAFSDGTIHSATVHFSHTTEPLKFFIGTSNDTVKVQPFLHGEIGKGAFVIGFSEQEMKTLQMHGTIQIVSDPAELEKIYAVHYREHPKAEQYKNDPTSVFMEFTPTWWRYSDLLTDPETILHS